MGPVIALGMQATSHTVELWARRAVDRAAQVVGVGIVLGLALAITWPRAA